MSEEKAESKADFSALSEEEITFTFDTVFIVRKWENTSIEPLQSISAPSAIAWSSARTTMRSRSMYTRTSPVRP